MAIFSNVVLLCLVSAVFGAFVNILARKILIHPEYSTEDFLPINFLFTFTTLAVLAPWFWKFHPGPTTYYWMGTMLLVDFFGNWFGFRGASKVKASTYSLVMAFSPLVTIALVAVTGGKATLSLPMVAGVFGVIAGLGMVSWSAAGGGSIRDDWRLLYYPITAMLIMGVGVYLSKHFLQSGDISSYSYMFIRYAFLLVSMALVFRPKKWKVCLRLSWRRIWGRSMLVIVQWWSLSQALLVGNLVVVKSLTDSVPIFVAIIALISGFEKPKRLELVGIIIATVGIMTIIRFS